MKREPAAIVAAITAAVAAVLTLLTAFGLPISEPQQTAILGVVTVVAPLVVGIITRAMVTPSRTVVAKIDTADHVVAGDAAPQDPGTRVKIETVQTPPTTP